MNDENTGFEPDDVEGHKKPGRNLSADDDVEGHAKGRGALAPEADGDDVEGHFKGKAI